MIVGRTLTNRYDYWRLNNDHSIGAKTPPSGPGVHQTACLLTSHHLNGSKRQGHFSDLLNKGGCNEGHRVRKCEGETMRMDGDTGMSQILLQLSGCGHSWLIQWACRIRKEVWYGLISRPAAGRQLGRILMHYLCF